MFPFPFKYLQRKFGPSSSPDHIHQAEKTAAIRLEEHRGSLGEYTLHISGILSRMKGVLHFKQEISGGEVRNTSFDLVFEDGLHSSRMGMRRGAKGRERRAGKESEGVGDARKVMEEALHGAF